MTDSADRIAMDLFERCLELGDDERKAFLESVCQDESMRTEVQRMLDRDASTGGLLPRLDDPDEEASSSASQRLLDQLESHRPARSRYRFLGEIDRGGMGAILRVHDADLNRHLAMKVVLGAAPHEPTGDTPPVDPVKIGRFLEEAQVTGQLDHPGVVPVHELSIDEKGRAYFTMRLVRGDDLRKVFERVLAGDETWTVTRAVGVLLKVAETMAYAHDKGVIHRDLKPANVMVGRFGEVYVMDWGLARVLGEPDPHDLRVAENSDLSHVQTLRHEETETAGSPLLTVDGTVIGTPSYMSPEQARSNPEEVGPQSDVYALGAMIYRLLTGFSPYVGPGEHPSPFAIWRWVLDGPPKPIAEHTPDAAPELIAICERAMERERADRYPDMAALADDLRAYLEGRVVTAYEHGAWAELRKWTKRNSALARSLAALVVVLVSSGFLLAWLERQRTYAAESRETTLLEVSDLARLERLERDSAGLWPIDDASRSRTAAWLVEAEELLSRAEGYRIRAATLLESAEPTVLDDPLAESSLEERALDIEYLVQRRELWQQRLDEGEEHAEDLGVLEYEIPRLEDRIARERWSLDLDRPRSILGSVEPTAFVRLTRISALLRRLDHPEFGRVPLISARRERLAIDLASALDDRLWDEVRADVDLDPIPLLRPLGRDPISGLWEFLHVPSGEAPLGRRGAWELKPETGVVLVLIPGGHATIGAQYEDPGGKNFSASAKTYYPGPLLDIDLGPYLLSKYELTIAQWERLTHELPNQTYAGSDFYSGPQKYGRASGIHPVETISHRDCSVLEAWGLELPTEAQWEYAARSKEPPLAPVRQVHDRVNSTEPNSRGLHHMLGNVWEWVREPHADKFEPSRFDGIEPDSGEIRVWSRMYRTARGGAYNGGPIDRHPAFRLRLSPDHRDGVTGVRPSITVR